MKTVWTTFLRRSTTLFSTVRAKRTNAHTNSRRNLVYTFFLSALPYTRINAYLAGEDMEPKEPREPRDEDDGGGGDD